MLTIVGVFPEVPGAPRLCVWEDAARIAALPDVNLRLCAGSRATLDAIAGVLRDPCDLVVWGGHGQSNRLLTADGRLVDGCWIATQARAGAPEAVVVAACFSALRDETLQSIAEEISTAGIHALAFATAPDDLAAGTFCVEFVRAISAGADVVRANRVAVSACASVNRETALAVQFVPAVINGYRALMRRFDGLGDRLSRLETGQNEILLRVTGLEERGTSRRRGGKT